MQILRSGKFQKFDYGKEKNLEKYQSEDAPLYDVDKLKFFDIPKYLYIGDKDYLANTNDYERLIELLPTNSTFSNVIREFI